MRRFINILIYSGAWCFRTLLSIMIMVSSAQGLNMPPEKLLQMADEVSERASKMAVKAKETNDYYQAQYAFALASEAVPWVFEVFETAQKMSDPKLAGAAQDAVERIRKAVGLSRIAAKKIAASRLDPDVAHAVNFLIESCEILLSQLRLSPE